MLRGERPAVPAFGDGVECPLFVTFKIDEGRGELQLRGCIGTLSPTPLRNLARYVQKSAFEDRRFNPIEASEVERLEVGVSLLVNYEEAGDPFDWEVGVHGILIDFNDKHGREYGATYLPEVMPEQGWDQRQAVESLMRKAGYRGRIDDAVLSTMRTTRYQSSKAAMTYAEYAAAA